MINFSNKSIKSRKIKFAIVGCGRISERHIDALKKHIKHAEIVAVCDTDPQKLSIAMESTSAKGYNSLTELLDEVDVDAVSICSPSGVHAQQAIQIAKSGKHIITEKPMATRWSDAQQMVTACDRAGVRLFVVKQNRHNSTLQILKEAVQKKRFGRINMVNINVFWTRPQDYYDQSKWRGTWEFDGGALMNQASHYIDLLSWLVGPVSCVQAFTATLGRDIEVEDTAVMNIRWRSGTLGSVNVTMLTYRQNYEGSITILGEKGTVKIGGVAVNEIQTWDFQDSSPGDEKIKAANYETASVYGFGHPFYYDNVIKTLRGEAEPCTDGREGLESLEVLIAAYLSARDGREVSLPLEY